MRYLVAVVLLCAALLSVQGCTVHFKGKDCELDIERQRVEHNETYELRSVGLLHAEAD